MQCKQLDDATDFVSSTCLLLYYDIDYKLVHLSLVGELLRLVHRGADWVRSSLVYGTNHHGQVYLYHTAL